MNRKLLALICTGLGWGLAASCTFDDRPVQLNFPLLGAGSGGGDAGSSLAGGPRLEVGSTSADLGWVTVGFPSRARVKITNSGAAALRAPVIGWSTGSDADFQVIQNQCLTDVAPGESCEVRVQLIPSRAATLAAVLHVESPSGGAADVSFTGLGLAAGDMLLRPAQGSFEDFGGVLVGSMVQGAFSLSNPGMQASGPLAFNLNRPDFVLLPSAGAAGECVPGTTSLLTGQSCDVRVAFTPSERGPVEATLTGRSDSGAGSVSATLIGRGLLPGVLGATAAQVDFDDVVLGERAQRSVTFANQGDDPLTLAGVSLSPADAEGFLIQNSDCAADKILAGAATCSVQLEFRPLRAGEEMTAELIGLAAAGQQRQSVALRGIGLERGLLDIVPVDPGGDAFGPVLLDGSLVRVFQVGNPSSQPSGVLSPTASDGFEVMSPPEAGECIPGSTSLVDGQTCTVRVRFSPTRREAHVGSLTVSSALAGAKSLALTGQGIIAAALGVDQEVNFGRVFTNAPRSLTLTISNTGDEPLAPPSIELTASSDAQAGAFSYESACLEPLAFGDECTLTVRFAPSQALPHSANLRLTSNPGGMATVLLLGEALAPGSLTFDEAQGVASDFGDVEIGASQARSFTLTNPGNVASALLTIRTDNSRFVVDTGNCNQGDAAGLIDGSSCTFSVTFSPNDSLQLVTNLSVQSPGAGQTGRELRGRGRLSASLSATGERSLGRANIGQDALTFPENQFTWTVNNVGDLASGALSVVGDNRTEFEISNDTCSNASVVGRGSCQMGIRFRPSNIGTRTGRIVVSDPASTRPPATIILTGLGVRLAALGGSCLNGETCAAGTCTGGKCCDRQCDGTCQACSAAGVCSDQSGRQVCGTGGGRCFGVNRCLLPEGQACGVAGDCGSSNCERRLGGQGQNDRICCLADCDPTGQQCNAQGQCQQPTLASGAVCGRPGDLACGGGLQCKACLGGGSRCTPAGACCGGCDAPYVCIDGNSCGCGLGSDGRRLVDCGDGLCIQDRANACCPDSPSSCSAALPNCDRADNRCKECVTANQCPGTNRSCTNGVCGCQAATPRSCGDGHCIANTECCQTCDGGRTCQGNPGACQCPGGGTQQFVNGQCRLNQGQPCTVNGTPCASGQCIDGVCCESACQGACAQCQASTGRCVMPASDPQFCPTTITCPAPTAAAPCKQSANITGSQCQTLGQCKTAANCVTSNAPARTACLIFEDLQCGAGTDACFTSTICNAAGACVSPTVGCEGQTLNTSADSCCILGFPPDPRNADFEGAFTECSPAGSSAITAWCDNENDCPTNSVCCMQDAGNYNSIACRTQCVEVNRGAINTAGVYRVCRSPDGGTSSCAPGKACTRTHPGLPGWSFCAFP